MPRIYEESENNLKVNRDYLAGKAKDREPLGSRDFTLPKPSDAYRIGWERIFGKRELPDVQE